MADIIERIYKLTVDGQPAIQQLKAITANTEALNARFDKMAAGAIKLGTALVGAFAAHEMIDSVKRNIDAMDELSKAVEKVGIAAEDLQRLRYAADLSGVSAEALDKAIGKLSVSMLDLKDGTSDTAKALRAIGVKSGDSPTEALAKISDQIAKMPPGFERTALAIKIFGKAGADLIPMLKDGGEEMKNLADQADRFGGVISGGALKASEEFNDNLSRIERTTTSMVRQITVGLLPALTAITRDIVGATKGGSDFTGVGDRIGMVLVRLYEMGIRAASSLQKFGSVVSALFEAVDRPTDSFKIFKALNSGLKLIDAETNLRLVTLRENLKALQDQIKEPGEKPKPSTDKTVENALAAEEAAKKHAKAEEERWKALIEGAKAEELINKTTEDRSLILSEAEQRAARQIEVYKKLTAESTAYLDNIEDEGERLQLLSDWLETGTDAQKKFAEAQILATKATAGITQTMVKQTDEVDVLRKGFEGFFDNLAQGTADASDLFKRMTQSILADLLRIWAKRYIINALFGTTGDGPVAAPGAANVPSSPSASSQSMPTLAPMGASLASMATTADALATGSRAGWQPSGQQAKPPPLNVTVNNYADVSVRTRQTGPSSVEVIVEQTRAAIAADLRNGGNAVSRSFEQAYGIGRGAAAAF